MSVLSDIHIGSSVSSYPLVKVCCCAVHLWMACLHTILVLHPVLKVILYVTVTCISLLSWN